ncbi:MAG: CC0125/CC1285 family lipoprotein [Thalassotalea sp.]
MKIFIIIIAMASLLSGCSSSPEYRAAKNNGYGYQESILNQDVIRVHYKSRSNNKLKAIDYTFLRAAELTQLQGYDWFIVTRREILADGKNSPTTSLHTGYGVNRDCGLFGCRNQPSSHIGIGVNLGEQAQELESILEIKLGKGVRPEKEESFGARELIDNMRKKYQLNEGQD